MFLLDDILLSPVKGLLWIFEEIHNAARADVEGERERITSELSDLYMQLETGQITDSQFDEREKSLLDRLDELGDEAKGNGGETAPEDDSEDEDEEG